LAPAATHFGATLVPAAAHVIGSGSAERLTARPAGTTASPLGYQEYLPPGYGEEPHPLLVFLHGVRASGDGSAAELENLLRTGIPRLIAEDAWPADRPFVVLAPQHDVPADDSIVDACADVENLGSCFAEMQHDLGHPRDASPCMTAGEARDFLTYAVDAYDVDPSRIFLTGLSCGGVGLWGYLAAGDGPPLRGAVPIATDGRPAWKAEGCALGGTAIWAFHGDTDGTMSPLGGTEPVANLEQCPSPPRHGVRLTVFPGVDHDSWSRTFDLSAGHDIYAWMLGL
jgi:predicted peptidase